MRQINRTALAIILVNVVLCGISLALFPLGIGMNPSSAPESGLVELTRYNRYTTKPAWSPDGRFIVFESQIEDSNPEKYAGHKGELHIIAVDGTHRKRITYSQRAVGQPAWSPDGQIIAFTDGAHVCLMRTDGSQLYCADASSAERLAWAPDGRSLLYDAASKIYRLAISAEAGQPLAPPAFIHDGTHAVWSPDGNCIAFKSGDVQIMRADGSSAVRPFALEGDAYPFGWSPDGRFLFINRYPPKSIHSQLSAHRLADGKEFRLTNNQQYHTAPTLSPDGKRIAFHSLRDYGYNLYLMDVRGLPPPEPNSSRSDCLPSLPGK